MRAFLDSQSHSFGLPALTPGPSSRDGCAHATRFEIRERESSNLVPLCHDSFDYSASLAFLDAVVGSVSISAKNRERTLGVLIGSCRMYRSVCGVLPS